MELSGRVWDEALIDFPYALDLGPSYFYWTEEGNI